MKQQQQLKNVKIMWHIGYYDGPLSGVLFYNNEIHYFKMTEEYGLKPTDPEDEESDTDWGWYRKHAIYELSNDDKVRLVTTHALWQAHVGLHTDYWPLNGRSMRAKRDETRKVPCLHYGPRIDQTFEHCEEFGVLNKSWKSKHGAFTLEGKEPIGWIYHDQLYGQDDVVENQE